jgi:hypothetical protein
LSNSPPLCQRTGPGSSGTPTRWQCVLYRTRYVFSLYSLHILPQSWKPGFTSLTEAGPDFDSQAQGVIRRVRDGTCLVRWKVQALFSWMCVCVCLESTSARSNHAFHRTRGKNWKTCHGSRLLRQRGCRYPPRLMVLVAVSVNRSQWAVSQEWSTHALMPQCCEGYDQSMHPAQPPIFMTLVAIS